MSALRDSCSQDSDPGRSSCWGWLRLSQDIINTLPELRHLV